MRSAPANTPSTSTFSARIPTTLYEALKSIAKRKKKSVNSVVTEALAAAEREERLARLQDSFRKLSKRKEEMDVDYAFQAQREVVVADED